MVTEKRRIAKAKTNRVHKRIKTRSELWSTDFHTILIKRETSRTLKTDVVHKLIEILFKLEQSITETTELIQNNMKQLNLVKNQHKVY